MIKYWLTMRILLDLRLHLRHSAFLSLNRLATLIRKMRRILIVSFDHTNVHSYSVHRLLLTKIPMTHWWVKLVYRNVDFFYCWNWKQRRSQMCLHTSPYISLNIYNQLLMIDTHCVCIKKVCVQMKYFSISRYLHLHTHTHTKAKKSRYFSQFYHNFGLEICFLSFSLLSHTSFRFNDIDSKRWRYCLSSFKFRNPLRTGSDLFHTYYTFKLIQCVHYLLFLLCLPSYFQWLDWLGIGQVLFLSSQNKNF